MKNFIFAPKKPQIGFIPAKWENLMHIPETLGISHVYFYLLLEEHQKHHYCSLSMYKETLVGGQFKYVLVEMQYGNF